MFQLPVLHQTDRWAVVAKPPRLACHRSALVQDRTTVMRLLPRQLGRDVHLVHRLDRGASGCLLVAFDGPTTALLQAAMTAPAATKTYLAFVRGFFRWDDPVVVDTPMAEEGGEPKAARSVVEVLGRSLEPRCSLLRVRPETGRFHQVRRHVRDLDHPILGDHDHGDSRVNVAWRDQHGLPRLGLHCMSVHIPLGGELGDEAISVTCPPPDDLAALWSRMPWWEDAQAAEPALQLPPIVLRSPYREGS